MYGTWTKLFVPDAKYRPSSTVQWSNTFTDISAITNIASTKLNFFIASDNSFYPPYEILTPIPTDDELQSKLSLSSIQSAKTCTNAIISSIGSSTSYAAGLARSCYISGLGYMDLPNLYELMVCWCEADNIDNMDPTADNYPDLKIGYTSTYGRFRAKYFWSSSEVDDMHVCAVGNIGNVDLKIKNASVIANILPILEL